MSFKEPVILLLSHSYWTTEYIATNKKAHTRYDNAIGRTLAYLSQRQSLDLTPPLTGKRVASSFPCFQFKSGQSVSSVPYSSDGTVQMDIGRVFMRQRKMLGSGI